MAESPAGEGGLVAFGEKLAASRAFSALFRDGMTLVEQTAAYLDGPGRQQSKRLARAFHPAFDPAALTPRSDQNPLDRTSP